MRNTIRISKEEYDTLREFRFKQLFKVPISPIFEENRRLQKQLEELENEIYKKNEMIEKLKEGIKWRDDGIKDLEDEIDKKNEEIEDLKKRLDELSATIKRQDSLITEKELIEKKLKSLDKTGVPAMDAVLERMCRVEAKIEARENPYFF